MKAYLFVEPGGSLNPVHLSPVHLSSVHLSLCLRLGNWTSMSHLRPRSTCRRLNAAWTGESNRLEHLLKVVWPDSDPPGVLHRLVQDLDMKVKVFHHFGKNVPKTFKMSPDAFIQMALQLAYYRWDDSQRQEAESRFTWFKTSAVESDRLFGSTCCSESELQQLKRYFVCRKYGRCCATYESASLRMFRLGRTDTIRSTSNASASFVKAFDDPSKQVLNQNRAPIRCFNVDDLKLSLKFVSVLLRTQRSWT